MNHVQDPLHVWRVDWGGAVEWFVATDEEALAGVIAEHITFTGGDPDNEPVSVIALDPARPLTVGDDEGGSATMTCAEWCAKEGRGFLASTER